MMPVLILVASSSIVTSCERARTRSLLVGVPVIFPLARSRTISDERTSGRYRHGQRSQLVAFRSKVQARNANPRERALAGIKIEVGNPRSHLSQSMQGGDSGSRTATVASHCLTSALPHPIGTTQVSLRTCIAQWIDLHGISNPACMSSATGIPRMQLAPRSETTAISTASSVTVASSSHSSRSRFPGDWLSEFLPNIAGCVLREAPMAVEGGISDSHRVPV
jgi:hypothetical protein